VSKVRIHADVEATVHGVDRDKIEPADLAKQITEKIAKALAADDVDGVTIITRAEDG
jgi:hypothetical protein